MSAEVLTLAERVPLLTETSQLGDLCARQGLTLLQARSVVRWVAGLSPETREAIFKAVRRIR